MVKGKDTKQEIIKTGLEIASRIGLESVTIGNLAKALHMSKSGLFAHFQSKENLQIAILDYAAEDFAADVIHPALQTERGIPRIMTLVENWIAWSYKYPGGCIFVSAGTEYSDRPGNVRDCLMRQQEQWLNCLNRVAQSAIKAGDFRKNTDCQQFAYDLYSLILGFYYYYKLLNDTASKQHQETALKRLLDSYRPLKKPGIKYKPALKMNTN